MVSKTVLILANSVKHGQHCVAGKCVDTKMWIRPVSSPSGSELSNEQIKFVNKYGCYPVKPLQKIYMCLQEHTPTDTQPENYLISGRLWEQRYKIDGKELPAYLDSPENIWGFNDRVSYAEIICGLAQIDQSLYLIMVSDLSIYINDVNRLRAKFYYNDFCYDLAITDPTIPYVNNFFQSAILCISLAGEFKGYCYKVVATIFQNIG